MTTATAKGDGTGYKPEYSRRDKTEWNALMSLIDKGLIEELPAGPRGGKRYFAVAMRAKEPTIPPTPEERTVEIEWTVEALDCYEPEPKPLPGLSLVLTADGGVKLS